MKRMPFAICMLVVLAWAGQIQAFEFASGRRHALGGNQFLSRPSATDLLNAPSSWLQGTWRIETGFVRTFDLSDLDQGFAAAAGRYHAFTAALGFSQLGQQDFYAERMAKLAVAWRHDSLAVGLTGSYFHLSFGGVYTPLSAYGVGGGVTWRRGFWLLGFYGDNLNSPKLYASAVPYRPVYSGQVELRSRPTLSTLARVELQKMERPRFSLGQWIELGKSGAFLWGIRTAPITYGGGLELSLGHARLTYGASYHPVLGLSQTISISVGSRSTREGGGSGFDW